MTEPVVQAASRLAEAVALLAIGYNLRQSGILKPSDGEVRSLFGTMCHERVSSHPCSFALLLPFRRSVPLTATMSQRDCCP